MNNKRKQLYRIGLTGGIASGKSKLRTYLRDTYPRIYTIDLDVYGHMVYQYNPLILKNIEGIFGKECLVHDSYGERIQINRDKLGQRVFTDPYMLRVLGSLVHPEIKRMMLEAISEVEFRYPD